MKLVEKRTNSLTLIISSLPIFFRSFHETIDWADPDLSAWLSWLNSGPLSEFGTHDLVLNYQKAVRSAVLKTGSTAFGEHLTQCKPCHNLLKLLETSPPEGLEALHEAIDLPPGVASAASLPRGPSIQVSQAFLSNIVPCSEEGGPKLHVNLKIGGAYYTLDFKVASVASYVFQVVLLEKWTASKLKDMTKDIKSITSFIKDKLAPAMAALTTAQTSIKDLTERYGGSDSSPQELSVAVTKIMELEHAALHDLVRQVAESLNASWQQLTTEIEEVLATEMSTNLLNEEGMEAKDLECAAEQNELFEISASVAAKEARRLWKEYFEMKPLFQDAEQALIALSQPAEEILNLKSEAFLDRFKTVLAILTAVQALFRALRSNETRKELCQKCRLLLSKHGMALPKKLDTLVKQFSMAVAADASPSP